ncbi:hypothetical protein CERSUDRAFT_111883 [Gelatoporia subvermispora B]|uniref:Uncharacterized protein n=1 Tax=Ceriporiopsis subvermispora (strain B) TaxID=914234 RepID=M2QR66_CERS8|nr:hypothetical protein CERSUDRAFT_111883 [Gelatoporia subvermispora B]
MDNDCRPISPRPVRSNMFSIPSKGKSTSEACSNRKTRSRLVRWDHNAELNIPYPRCRYSRDGIS